MNRIPKKIFLIGLMGSGKSYWGRQMAVHFKYPFLDLDKGIEMAEGFSISQIFQQKGEIAFRLMEQYTLEHSIVQYQKFVMSCGGGTACFFDNIATMKSNGIVVWLKPSFNILAQRLITAKHKRPLIKNATTEQDIVAILEGLMHKRQHYYQQANVVIDDPNPTLDTFKKKLERCTEGY